MREKFCGEIANRFTNFGCIRARNDFLLSRSPKILGTNKIFVPQKILVQAE